MKAHVKGQRQSARPSAIWRHVSMLSGPRSEEQGGQQGLTRIHKSCLFRNFGPRVEAVAPHAHHGQPAPSDPGGGGSPARCVPPPPCVPRPPAPRLSPCCTPAPRPRCTPAPCTPAPWPRCTPAPCTPAPCTPGPWPRRPPSPRSAACRARGAPIGAPPSADNPRDEPAAPRPRRCRADSGRAVHCSGPTVHGSTVHGSTVQGTGAAEGGRAVLIRDGPPPLASLPLASLPSPPPPSPAPRPAALPPSLDAASRM